ncbi:30S ribosomal protein S17, partial [Capsicum annuum]
VMNKICVPSTFFQQSSGDWYRAANCISKIDSAREQAGKGMEAPVYYKPYVIERFANEKEKDGILCSGPHYLLKRPVIMKPWSPEFNFNEDILSTIPLWIKLPNLPLNCWNAVTLSKIGSSLGGQPLYVDECTTHTSRISFARILVEVDVTRKLSKSIKKPTRDGGREVVPVKEHVPGEDTGKTIVPEKERSHEHEGWVRGDKTSAIMNKVMLGWAWTTNATTSIRGRIWVAWNPDEVLYTVLETTEQYIQCNISEMPAVGRSFTWTNEHVYNRIDKALVNAEWGLNMPPTQVQVLQPQFSDHSSINISLEEQEDNMHRPFKFYNGIAQHPDFKATVKDKWVLQWQGPRGIWQNLKGIRQEIQLLNKREYLGVTEKVRSIRKDLLEKQSLMTNAPIPTEVFDEDKELQLQLNKWRHIEKSILNKWRHIEKSIYRQKAREQWIKLGDSNTSYFFAHMKGRKIQNQIKVLTIADGNIIRDSDDIKSEVVEF